MKIVRKPLRDVKVGDVLIDSDARLTTVTGETVEETPSQLFELEILNDDGQKMKVRADSGHAWPLDPGAYGSTPPEAEGETEASTGDIARWVARGWQPQLSPVLTDGTVMHWIVRRALLLPDSVARSTKVKCVRVDSPTHSFMLADNSDLKNFGKAPEVTENTVKAESVLGNSGSIVVSGDSDQQVIHSELMNAPVTGNLKNNGDSDSVLSLNDLAGMDLDDAPSVMHVDREAFDLITKHGMPTHNCGGPLTLDTLINTPDGPVMMGDVAVGDKVLNPVGGETEVLWKSPLMLPEALLRLTIGPAEDPGVSSWSMSDLIYAEMQYRITDAESVPSILDFLKSGAIGDVDLSKMRNSISDGDFVTTDDVDDGDKSFLSDRTSSILIRDKNTNTDLSDPESYATDVDVSDAFVDTGSDDDRGMISKRGSGPSSGNDSRTYGNELIVNEAFLAVNTMREGEAEPYDHNDSVDLADGSLGSSYVVKCDSSHLWTVYDKTMGLVRVVSMNEMFRTGLDNWLIPLVGGGWGEILKADVIDSEPVQCILVDDASHDYQLGNEVITHNTGGGKSVLQRNVVFHVIAHARQIKFFGIDLKKVELSAYRPYSPVLYIATTLEDAVQVLTTAQDLMMSRYAEMEENHVNNFLDLDNPGSALLVMVDEAGELLDCSSPAKALGGDTPIRTLEDGEIPLRDVEAGHHHILGSDLQWHDVVRKYEPESQDHYRVTAVRSSDGARESFVAGSEHLWRVWAPVELRGDLLRIVSAAAGESVEDHDDGSVSVVLSTRKLKALKDAIPGNRWSGVRLKRVAES